MKIVDVKLKSNSYQVFIGSNILLGILNKYDWGNVSKILIITDSNISLLYKDKILDLFNSINKEKHFFVIDAGEESKSYKTIKEILSYLILNGFGRDSLIVALGGGVVGDITGFAASIYMRGVPYCQIPTTLLAAVDSSIGGKTGINLNKTKNIVGSFYQPKFVVTDLNFIDTLPKEEWICGLGEVLKYCFLSEYSFFEYFNKNFNGILNKEYKPVENIIIESVSIKSAIVSKDEKEKSLRKILNLGHTFAHGFESAVNYKIKHGEAVIAGIGCAAILSQRLGILSSQKLKTFSELLNKFELRINYLNLDIKKVYNAMLRDKKNKQGKIKFVLIRDIGQIIIDIEATRNDVFNTLQQYPHYFPTKNSLIKN